MLADPERYPSAIELVLDGYAPLIAVRGASPLALEAAVAAMAPATRAAITADLKCFLHWCGTRCPAVTAVPAEPETLVHYLRWLAKGSETRGPAKPATLARRLASIARIHRMLGLGETAPLPTQAGMVRDTLKAIRRDKRQRAGTAHRNQRRVGIEHQLDRRGVPLRRVEHARASGSQAQNGLKTGVSASAVLP